MNLPFQIFGGAHTHGLKASHKFLLCVNAHVLRIHFARYKNGHNITGVYACISEEPLHTSRLDIPCGSILVLVKCLDYPIWDSRLSLDLSCLTMSSHKECLCSLIYIPKS
jgi:hypothetical protein